MILPAHLAARDAELIEQFQFAPELRAGNFAPQQLPIFRDGADDFLGIFIQKFHAEIADAEREEPFHKFRAGLRLRIEDGVAAAGVGLERMLRAHAVAQAHVMRVARAAAVAIILAAGKKRAEHAMLHVKHRHVLMNGDLEPFRRRGGQQRVELHDIQIVAGGDAFEAEMIFKIVRCDAIRDVQRKIADATCVREEFQMVVVADEIAVGIAGTNLI